MRLRWLLLLAVGAGCASYWRYRRPSFEPEGDLPGPTVRRVPLANELAAFAIDTGSDAAVVTAAWRVTPADEDGARGLRDASWRYLFRRGKLPATVADGGGSLAQSAGYSGLLLFATAMSADLEAVLSAFVGQLSVPSCSEALLRETVDELRRLHGDAPLSPDAVVHQRLLTHVLGPAYPMSYDEAASSSGSDAIDCRAVESFWARHLGPSRLAVVVAGPPVERSAPLLERHLGPWVKQASHNVRPPAPEPSRVQALVLPRPGAAQTIISVGAAVLPGNFGDLLTARLAMSAYGATMMDELREQRAASYEVSASAARRGDRILVHAQTRVDAPQTAVALRQLSRGFAGTRFDLAQRWNYRQVDRRARAHGRLLALWTARGAAEAAAQRFLDYDSVEGIEHEPEAMLALDWARVMRFIDGELQDDRTRMVVAGDPERVVGALEGLGISYAVLPSE